MLQLTELERVCESLPVVKSLLAQIYEKRFSGECYASVRGVFRDFDEARKSAPATKPVGFDAPEGALDFAERRTRIAPCDYPVIFWLNHILAENQTLFDFGGHVGGQFYAFSRYVQYPPGFVWKVCDLPAIVRAGEELATREQASSLQFTERLEDAAGADIFMAAGSIHYLESPRLADWLAALHPKPLHLLLNKLPLYDGETFVTLQNNGFGYNPFYVFNRNGFLSALEALGYRLMDSWHDESRSGRIPFHPERSFRCYSGVYLRRVP